MIMWYLVYCLWMMKMDIGDKMSKKSGKVIIEVSNEKFARVWQDLVLAFVKHGLDARERLSFIMEVYLEMQKEAERITGKKIQTIEETSDEKH